MAAENVEHYEVEKIVDHRLMPDGSAEFLVKWVGYRDEENTWEPLTSLELSQEALNCYTNGFNDANPLRLPEKEPVETKKKADSSKPKSKNKKVKEEPASPPDTGCCRAKRSAPKRKADKPIEEEIEEEEMDEEEFKKFAKGIIELTSDQTLITNVLSRVSADPFGRGVCVFCNEHFAPELCKKYPTYKARMRLVERENRCKACGSKEHRMKKFPPCNPSWCIFCQKQGHIEHMCKVFTAGVIDPFVSK